ncbi:MAG TPA: chromate transporter [Pyrinomonadaceae bacterium]|nr:chromate transporter [Pyrinomonadaceae bacterium]
MPENAEKRTGRFTRRVRYGQKRLKRLSETASLSGIFLSFLYVGLTGFGGGLAVIAQIRVLAVRKRRWFTEHEFAEAFALAQSLPGTNAGNAVSYIGWRLRGLQGAAVAMIGFILPSMLMMVALAIGYRHLRQLPNMDRLFHGLNAAVVALIIVTAWRMGRNTLTKPWQWYVAVFACLSVAIFGATIIEVILAAGLVGIYIDSFAERRWQRWRRIRRLAARRRERLAELESKNFVGGYLTRAMAEERVRRASHKDEDEADKTEEQSPSSGTTLRSFAVLLLAAMPVLAKAALLITLSMIFLRIGTVTFGGGFVMVPLIEAEVVNTHGWLTHQEFADATALGQLTPGPVLITATFIGYRVAGTLGALFATISVFLPAFVMTIIAGSYLRRFRANRQVQAFLRGVTPAVVGLLAAASWSIGRAGLHSWVGVMIMIACVVVLLRFRPNPFWVIVGAGSARLLMGLLIA